MMWEKKWGDKIGHFGGSHWFPNGFVRILARKIH